MKHDYRLEPSDELIVKFMGDVIVEKEEAYNSELHCPDGMIITAFHPSELKYDESWDWLMPVIDKIVNQTPMESHFRKIALDQIFSALTTVNVENVYKAVVLFLENYNGLRKS